MTDAAPVLAAHGVTRRFGAFTALDGVDFAVRGGEIHALLGENGAGKSTLMNVLSGLLRPSAGEVRVDGRPVRFASPRDAAAAGIGMVHQHFLLVPPLTVRENLLLGAPAAAGGPLSYPVAAVEAEARALADRLGWRIPWDQPAGDLPVGVQQRVEILKALRGSTRVLIFDEPTAVLTPTETPELFATIRSLAAEGKGIVFISHKLDEVLSLARTVTVLRRGRVVLRTTAAESDAAALAAAMVGGDALSGETAPPPPNNGGRGDLLVQDGGGAPAAQDETPGKTHSSSPRTRPSESPLPPLLGGGGAVSPDNASPPTIAAADLTLRSDRTGAPPRLRGLSFEVSAGETLGIAGVDGNGQAELAECLAGLVRPDGGQIWIDGRMPPANAAAFRSAGVALIPADRQRRGLALDLTLTENLALGVQDDAAFRRGPLLLWPRLRKRAETLIAAFDVRASGAESPARALSGGNQQKVVIARALAGKPRVVVAVNPTRGLDVGATAYVHAALRRATAAGAAVVLISTDLDEVLALSGRIAVLFEGAFSGIVAPDASRERIGLLMGGREAEAA